MPRLKKSEVDNLVRAAASGDASTVRELLLRCTAEDQLREVATSALFPAILDNDRNCETVQLLLEHGAEPNKLFIGGTEKNKARTALNAAVSSLSPQTADLLLDAGANPCIVCEASSTAAHRLLARAGDYANLPNGKSILTKLLDRFLDAGVPINQFNPEVNSQATLLHAAIIHNAPLSTISLLLDRGADLHLYDSTGSRPLHVAAMQDRVEVIDLLLKRGADPNATDNFRRTPFWHIKSRASGQALIDAGADINARDISGRSLLSWRLADMTGDEPITPAVQILLELNADLDTSNFMGKLSARTVCEQYLDVAQQEAVVAFIAARDARTVMRQFASQSATKARNKPTTR